MHLTGGHAPDRLTAQHSGLSGRVQENPLTCSALALPFAWKSISREREAREKERAEGGENLTAQGRRLQAGRQAHTQACKQAGMGEGGVDG